MPQVTVEVADVDAIHVQAVRRGVPVVCPLTDEPWGVRAFLFATRTASFSTSCATVQAHQPREGGDTPLPRKDPYPPAPSFAGEPRP